MPEQGRDGTTRARRHVKYSDELKLRCMRLLELRRERFLGRDKIKPASSIVLARALKHWPGMKRETLRRRVRELVDEMRREGAPIASGPAGYWAAETVEDFEKTAGFLRRIGLAPLATNARLKETAAAARATRQLRFAPYHAAITGGLANYLPKTTRRSGPVTAAGDVEDSSDAPASSEQSGQQWTDSPFATA